MSISPVSTGLSTYATDFQSVIDRSIAIASLPLNQLQNQLSTMNSQTTAIEALDTKFADLLTAIQNIGSTVGSGSYAAVSSNPAALSATIGPGAIEGAYSLNIQNVGSYTTSISDPSLPAVTDPYESSISSSTSFTLTVNGSAYQVNAGGGSLMDLASAINESSSPVKALVINTGGSDAPQYRLILRGTKLGADTIQLSDGTTDLLSVLSVGEQAAYTVNGIPTPVYSSSRTVTLAPGVTVDLLQTTPEQPVTVTVSRNGDSIRDAIATFADAYNAAVDELDKHVGENAGILAGQSVLRDLRAVLRRIVQYSATNGPINSLRQAGLDLDKLGHLTFNAATLSDDTFNALESFLGSSIANGFLKGAVDALDAIEDPFSGSIATALQRMKDGVTRQNDRIQTERERIAALSDRLQEQMAAADALIASLQAQRNYITNLFTAMMNSGNASGVKSY